jgi:hypothetical protein
MQNPGSDAGVFVFMRQIPSARIVRSFRDLREIIELNVFDRAHYNLVVQTGMEVDRRPFSVRCALIIA